MRARWLRGTRSPAQATRERSAAEAFRSRDALARRSALALVAARRRIGVWAAGQLATCVYEIGLECTCPNPPLPMSASSGYILMICGLLAFISTPAGRLSQLRGVIEGLFTASGFLLCSWTLVIGSVVAKSGSLDFAGMVNLAYPLLDAIALAASVLRRAAQQAQPARRPGPARCRHRAAGGRGLLLVYVTEVDPSAPASRRSRQAGSRDSC